MFFHATCVFFLVLKGTFSFFSWLHVLFSMVIGLFFYSNKLSQNLQPTNQRKEYHHLCMCNVMGTKFMISIFQYEFP